MNKAKRKELKVSVVPIVIGGFITIVYLLGFGFVFRKKLVGFQDLELNNAGDFLAGFFAPLAFLWLVVSLWMQRSELMQNTEVLKVQLEELKNSVEHQSNIAAAAQAELALYKPYFEFDRDHTRLQMVSDSVVDCQLRLRVSSTAGVLRDAALVFTLCGHTVEQHLGELGVGLHEYRFDVMQQPSDIFNQMQIGEVALRGSDVHGEIYQIRAEVSLDFPKFKVFIENHNVPEPYDAPRTMKAEMRRIG